MKGYIAAFICICTVFCTGCGSADATEVRDRAYVQSAVFSGKEETELTLYPFEEAGELIKGTGANISAAVEEASVKAGREVFLGHTELLCFDDPQFTDELSKCLQEYRLSPSCKLLYLHETELPEDCNTTALTDSLTKEEEKGRIPETDLFRILSELSGGDSTVLIPALTENGFGIGVINGSEFMGILSERAVMGLMWLRGENFPERIAIAGDSGAEDYEIYSACTKLSAEIKNGIPHITVNIKVKGKGNSEAVKRIIKAYCQAAEEETLRQMQADVIGLDVCIAQDCPEYYAAQDFETAKWAAVVEYDIIA